MKAFYETLDHDMLSSMCSHVSSHTLVKLAHAPAPPPRYEMEMKEKQSQVEGEDMSDMVAEHVAKQKVRTTALTHAHTHTVRIIIYIIICNYP